MPEATDDVEAIATLAVALVDRTDAGTRPVRLLGVGVHNLLDHDEPLLRPRTSFSLEPWLPFDEAE
jgi:hypothetical protein